MTKNYIPYISIILLLINSSCTAIEKISINNQTSSEIKGREFTIISKENDLFNFSSSSFFIKFIGSFVPWGVIWIPKVIGKREVVRYNLQDPTLIFKKEISKILTMKYDMKFKDNSIIETESNIQKLSKIYKNYNFLIDVSDAGSLTYVKFDDHRFDFQVTFKIIDTKKIEIVAQSTCSYSTNRNNYRSRFFYLDNEAENLKKEISEAVKQCLEVFKAEI